MNSSACNIEQFPHIVLTLTRAWGTVAFEKVIDELTMDRERFNRRGFPNGPFRELASLKELHHIAYPELIRVDPWDTKGAGISK